MEIDLISIVIGIIGLSTFFIPIGLYQFSEKRKLKNARIAFKNASDRHGFQIDDFEVFRNGVVLGIDYQNQVVMHLMNNEETVLKFEDIHNCRIYKTQHHEITDNNSLTLMLEVGIEINVRDAKHGGLRLPIIKWKEGNTFNDESLITQRWIRKIKAIQMPEKVFA